MTALNLGCGTRTSEKCLNIDWSVPVRLKGSPVGRKVAPLVLKGARRELFDSMRGELLRHDLRKGIPADSGSVELVYHSHVLEHIDREFVPGFLSEIRRVLKPGGVHRIVVPDLEGLVRAYVANLDAIEAGGGDPEGHDELVAGFIEQSVRREAAGTAQQSGARRRLENMALGDARSRGETHQWMWDRVNLSRVLLDAGFSSPTVRDFRTSAVPDWDSFGLDIEPDGSEYKPGSLYMECTV